MRIACPYVYHAVEYLYKAVEYLYKNVFGDIQALRKGRRNPLQISGLYHFYIQTSKIAYSLFWNSMFCFNDTIRIAYYLSYS